MISFGVFRCRVKPIYDKGRKYNMRKKGQKRDCTATWTVLHLYQKLIERFDPNIQLKTKNSRSGKTKTNSLEKPKTKIQTSKGKTKTNI